ncbi:MAG TPA: M15 family metallopeptidase [Opitutus sp.]|nr:M15 family metallopeptidase [Opitutus sp.]
MTAESIRALHHALGIPPDYLAARGLPLQPEAGAAELVLVACAADDHREIHLVTPAADAWRRMHDAAAADGITLLPLSGFRSVARQAEIVRAQLAAGRAIGEVLRLVAAPGCSEHHTGRALDLGTPGEPPLEEGFATTPAFAWLRRRAREFGFALSYPPGNPHGIAFEPWHWCWRERPADRANWQNYAAV